MITKLTGSLCLLAQPQQVRTATSVGPARYRRACSRTWTLVRNSSATSSGSSPPIWPATVSKTAKVSSRSFELQKGAALDSHQLLGSLPVSWLQNIFYEGNWQIFASCRTLLPLGGGSRNFIFLLAPSCQLPAEAKLSWPKFVMVAAETSGSSLLVPSQMTRLFAKARCLLIVAAVFLSTSLGCSLQATRRTASEKCLNGVTFDRDDVAVRKSRHTN